MGRDGFLFLADFGLAKEMSQLDMATSFCGTPEYLAPEIIKNAGHNHAVDWWAIGILIYEMIVGFPPFYHKNQTTMYELIEKFPESELFKKAEKQLKKVEEKQKQAKG